MHINMTKFRWASNILYGGGGDNIAGTANPKLYGEAINREQNNSGKKKKEKWIVK
jgi:hypothetical protein